MDPDKYRSVTRLGDIAKVLAGLGAAESAELSIKINAVALKGFNAEAPGLLEWAHGRGYDLTFIEVMPLGAVDAKRFDQFLPSTRLRADLERRFTLEPSLYATGGPARYFQVKEREREWASSLRSPTIFARAATNASDMHWNLVHVPRARGRSRPSSTVAPVRGG